MLKPTPNDKAEKRLAWVISRLKTLPDENYHRAIIALASGCHVSKLTKWLPVQPDRGGLQLAAFETVRKYLTPLNKNIKRWLRLPDPESMPDVLREALEWQENCEQKEAHKSP
jgi:hypothetical protein